MIKYLFYSIPDYSQGIHQGNHHLYQPHPLMLSSTRYSTILHTSAIDRFPYHTPSRCHLLGNMTQNQWDRECKEMYLQLQTKPLLHLANVTHSYEFECIFFLFKFTSGPSFRPLFLVLYECLEVPWISSAPSG